MQGNGQRGLVDFLVESDPPNRRYTMIEFKNIQIDYLDLRGDSRADKAEQLVAMSWPQILKLRIIRSNYHPNTIEEWLEGQIHEQLRSYVTSPTVRAESIGKNFRAYAVVIIGSRHILIREMDNNGEWKGDSRLVGRDERIVKGVVL